MSLLGQRPVKEGYPNSDQYLVPLKVVIQNAPRAVRIGSNLVLKHLKRLHTENTLDVLFLYSFMVLIAPNTISLFGAPRFDTLPYCRLQYCTVSVLDNTIKFCTQ